MKKITSFIVFSLILSSIIIYTAIYTTDSKCETQYNREWKKQLDEMNYLIMRTSAINIINGLHLNYKQAKALKHLSKLILKTRPPVPDMKGNASKELIRIRKSYIKLIRYLKIKRKISTKFKHHITKMRLLESEIIKKSVIGAKNRAYSGKGCISCHTSPDHFPKGDLSKLNNPVISKEERIRIDKAHVIGLYGQKGMYKLWNLKSKVDTILTNGQKLILKDFQCCLLPPENLRDPTNIGQASSKDKWIAYFRKIRGVSKEDWPNIKYLYIVPIEDIIKATLPSITVKDKKKILKDVDIIIEDMRKLDNVDFELKKESLCIKLSDKLNVGSLIRETEQQKETRQFVAAMFLLLPGNEAIYNRIIRKKTNMK